MHVLVWRFTCWRHMWTFCQTSHLILEPSFVKWLPSSFSIGKQPRIQGVKGLHVKVYPKDFLATCWQLLIGFV
jgi:hypothetical protein